MLIRPLYANYRAPCFFFIRIYEICEIYERKKHRGERWSYSNEHCQWPIWLEDGRANQGALTSPVGLAMTSRILHWRLPFLPFSLSLCLSFSLTQSNQFWWIGSNCYSLLRHLHFCDFASRDEISDEDFGHGSAIGDGMRLDCYDNSIILWCIITGRVAGSNCWHLHWIFSTEDLIILSFFPPFK